MERLRDALVGTQLVIDATGKTTTGHIVTFNGSFQRPADNTNHRRSADIRSNSDLGRFCARLRAILTQGGHGVATPGALHMEVISSHVTAPTPAQMCAILRALPATYTFTWRGLAIAGSRAVALPVVVNGHIRHITIYHYDTAGKAASALQHLKANWPSAAIS
jgi:hypothetical protein